MKHIILILSFIMLAGCLSEQGNTSSEAKPEVDPTELVNQYPVYDLSDEQKEDLAFMWEEEKLARDVYRYFIGRWGSKVFVNISGAEQVHMDALAALLEKYDIAQGVDPNIEGQFSIPLLQQLYDELTSRGDISEHEAFAVGKDIEDLDISDLLSRITTAEADAVAIYNNLLEGSYKHLSAFNRQLSK